MKSAARIPVQATLSHYRILERIGAGGMGVVYRARDQRLERDVALKVLPAGALADEAARKRFRKEALALSRLNHPNIATVHDFGTEEGTDFLVEELIEGLSLDVIVRGRPLSLKEIINLGSQLCEGLAEAHDRGVIHRDLKPGNVRVTPDARLKILDFGLAKVVQRADPLDATASLTETQTISGTVPYMAPEQLLNKNLGAYTDIWAAGCVLYEMATGRRPFLGSGPALTDAILHHPPASSSVLDNKIAPGLQAIILKCLEKDPSLRYQSAREIALDLRRLVSSGASALVPTPRPRIPNVALAVVLLALAVTVLWFWRERRKTPESPHVTRSVAVLPFVDMSAEKNQEYLADGLAEEMLNTLAKIPELRVAARTSSFQFKGKGARLADIGRELNVATVLEGSVRSQGRRVRISVELVNASDGFHLWSETYNRDLTDIFAVEEDIARSVAGSLKVALLGGKTVRLVAQVNNPAAYSAYLQGRYLFEQSGEKNIEKAIGYYEQAVKQDPGSARAWAGLGEARSRQAGLGYVPAEEGYRMAREAAGRALTLDPDLAEAHVAMGWIEMYYDWDWPKADASFQRALALEPGNAMVLGSAAFLAAALGRLEEASALDRRAAELDPHNPQVQ